MTPLPLCAACRRVVQECVRRPIQIQSHSEPCTLPRLYRPVSTVRRYGAPPASSPASYQQKKAEQTGKTSTSQPTQPPKSKTINTDQTSTASTTESIAMSIRKNLPSLTETYVAYSSCEKLVKECARQAQYSIRSTEKNATIPKTKDGAQLGVGDGWWYKSMSCHPLILQARIELAVMANFLHSWSSN